MGLFDELQNTPEVPEDNQPLEARGESLEAPEASPETPEEALLVARSGRKAVEQEEGMEFGNPTDFAEQFNNTLISAIGAPVDLTTWALNGASKLLGGPELIDPETAVGGSASLKSALNPLDIGSDRKADTYMGYAGNTFGEAAAFLAGGAGVVQKTKQAGGVIGSISKQADEALRTKLDDVLAVEATAALGMAGGRQYAEENEMGATGSLVLEFTTGALAMVSGAAAKKAVLDPLTAKLKNMSPKEALENLSKEEVAEVVAEGQRVIAKEQPPAPKEAQKTPVEAPEASATPKTGWDSLTDAEKKLKREIALKYKDKVLDKAAEVRAKFEPKLKAVRGNQKETYKLLEKQDKAVKKAVQKIHDEGMAEFEAARAKLPKEAPATAAEPTPAPKKDYKIESVLDEYGEVDFDADEALRKIAKERDLGITSDREANTVVRNEDGEVIGGTFVSNDGDNYTFDVVVSEAADGTGVGSKLLDDVIEMPYELREMNPDATMQVDVVSPKMKEMLERRGFEVKEEIGKDRWLMEPKDYDNVGKPKIAEPTPASKIYHGTGSDFNDFDDGVAWFTPDKDVADSYRKRSTVRNQADEAGTDIEHEFLFESDASIEQLAKDEGFNLDGGRVIEKDLPDGKQLDLTNQPNTIDSVEDLEDTWRFLYDKGLVRESWDDLDEEALNTLRYDYFTDEDGSTGVALWRILEEEGVYDAARSNGYETVRIRDVSTSGKEHDAIGVLNPKKLNNAPAEPTPAPKAPEAAPEVDPIDASIKATREILEGDRSGGKGARVTAQVKPHFKAVASDMGDRFNSFAKAANPDEAKKAAADILERLDQFIEFDRIIAKKDYAQGSELVANKGGITPESFRTEISAEANKRSADLQTLRNMLNDFVGGKTTKEEASEAAAKVADSITPQQKVEAIRNHLQSISRGRSRGMLMSVFDGYFTTRTAMALNQVKTGLVGTMSAAIKHILRPLESTLNSTDGAIRLKDASVKRRLQYALSEIAATDEYIITMVRHHKALLKNMGNTILETGDSTLLYKEAQAYKGQDVINGQPSNFFSRRNNARAARNEAYRNAKNPLDKSYKGLKKAMLNNSVADSVPLLFNYGFSLIGAFEDVSLMTLSRRAQKARAIQAGIREGVDDIGKYVDDWMEDAFQMQENGTMRANYDPKYQDGFNEARYDHFRNLDLPANDIRNEAEQAVVAALNKVAESPTELGMLTKFIMMFRGVPTRAGAQLLSYTPPVAGYKVARQLVGKGVNAVEKRVGTGQVSFGKYQSKISELELQIKEQKAILKSSDDSDIVKAAQATIADNEDQISRLNVMRREEEYRDIARFVVATAIFLKGYQDGQMGLATGSQSHLTDEQKFAAQKVDGAPTDWKIRFGELELDYRYAEPLKGAYGMGASWGQRQATIDAGALTKDQTATQFFVSAYRDMLLDMPALQGAKTVVQATSANPETRAKAATNLKRQAIPAPAELRNILKYDEEFIGDTTQGISTQSAWRAAVGLEQDNYKLTVLGEPKQKETPTLVGHITPLGLKVAVERTELDDILLEDAFTFKSISAPQTSVGGFQLKKFVHMDEDNGETLYSLYGRLISETRISGKTQRQALEALIKTSDFKRAYNNNKYTMDDKGTEINEGIEMLKDIISEYRAEARSQILENKAANDYVDSDGNNIYDILKEREEFSEQPESLLESLNLK